MADDRITELTPLGAAPDPSDVIAIVDISDGPLTKKVTIANLLSSIDPSSFVTIANPPQTVTGDKTFSGLFTLGDYSFPAVDGAADQVLITDGLGALTFQDPASGLPVSTALNNTLMGDGAGGWVENNAVTIEDFGSQGTVRVVSQSSSAISDASFYTTMGGVGHYILGASSTDDADTFGISWDLSLSDVNEEVNFNWLTYFNGVPLKFRRGDSSIHFDSSRVIAQNGSLFLLETPAGNLDRSTYGQFWVTNAATQVPMFTDESGVDTPLIGAGSTSIPIVLADNEEIQFGNLAGGDTQLLFTGVDFQIRTSSGGVRIDGLTSIAGNNSFRIEGTVAAIYTNFQRLLLSTVVGPSVTGLDFIFAAGQHVRIFDDADTGFMQMDHDSTDFNFTFSTVTDVNLTGATGLNLNFTNIGFYGTTPAAQSAAYTRNATIVEDRTLLASASATALNNNNVLAALIADLQATGIIG